VNKNINIICEYVINSKIRKLRFKKYCWGQKYFNKMIHRLSTYKTKQKKVGSYMMGIGNWYFKQNSPIRSRRLPLKYFENKLAIINKHCFSIVDEHLTSKLCHQCKQPLSFYDKKHQDMMQMVIGVKAPYSKIFYCQNCNVVLDRDVNGSINIKKF
jgi:hypothetical protein